MRHGTFQVSIQRGFTLVELILVVVMVTALSAAVAPRFFSKSSYDERFFLDEVKYALSYAQRRAVASGCRIQVSIQDDLGYRVTRDAECFSSNPPNFDKSGFNNEVWNPASQSFGLYNSSEPDSVVISSTINPIVFNAQGKLEDSSQNRIVSASFSFAGSQRYNLTIDGETGFSRITKDSTVIF